ncbi:hypothetical protein ROZALSC1DRAFT_29239, partial [Rozella allomycis CSF55]
MYEGIFGPTAFRLILVVCVLWLIGSLIGLWGVVKKSHARVKVFAKAYWTAFVVVGFVALKHGEVSVAIAALVTVSFAVSLISGLIVDEYVSLLRVEMYGVPVSGHVKLPHGHAQEEK